MRRNGKSREDIAEALNVSLVSVCRYLSGARTPKDEVMVKIKTMTRNQVTADDFLPAESEAAA